MVSKNLIKLVHSLEQKKYRLREGLFVAEGPKVVGDLMEHYTPRKIVATAEWLSGNADRLGTAEVSEASDDELCRTSLLQHPQQVVALFPLGGGNALPSGDVAANELVLVLDGVQDPGNLGTIIRIADWFGVSHIVCSQDTADAFNPKVVQATMGSIARVSVAYTDLCQWLDALDGNIPVYGTLLDGGNIYAQQLSANGIIVMGNEGKGISPAVRQRISHSLLIPPFSVNESHAESLNVAIATAIVCSEFRSRGLKIVK